MDDLVSAARAGKLDPVYVLHSEHPILLERVVAAIRDAAVPPAARGFNYDVVEGKPTGARLVALAQTLPMMAARRMIFVRDLGLMAADEAEPLIRYLAAPNPSTVVVAQTGKLDKRLKLFAAVSKKGWLHVLEAPRQLVPWVRAEAKAKNVVIDPPAVQRLVDVIGADLSRLALALEQLALYAGERPITADDVDELIAETRERKVFDLADAIGAGDRGLALAVVASLADQRESAVGAIVILARHMRNLATLHTLRAANVPRNEWGARIGVPPFVVDKLASQACGFTPAALAVAIARLAAADRALKGDITLDGLTSPFTGPQMKALGRDLGERVILERVVGGIVDLARP